jgi:hypothetical protein
MSRLSRRCRCEVTQGEFGGIGGVAGPGGAGTQRGAGGHQLSDAQLVQLLAELAGSGDDQGADAPLHVR